MTRLWLIATRLLLLIALATSAVLYTYYLDPVDSQFCAAQSGCETLRRSPLAYFFGSPYVSLPLFGMLAFAGTFGLSLWSERRPSQQRYLFLCGALSVGAASAVGLIAYQAWVAQAFCWLCLLADTAAVFAAVSALLLHRSVSLGETERRGLRLWAWVALALIAIGAPLLWGVVRPLPPVPAPIRALYQPGKINVVEFADLECPHCRKLHPLLKGVIESYPGQVNFVRKHAPLPHHPNAERASSAIICADTLAGRGEEMADRLVSEPLSPSAPIKFATELRLDMLAFEACLAAPSTLARIDEDLALLRAVGFEGLPTTYVGAQRFIGARNEEAWRDAFESAARGEGERGVPGALYLSLLSLLAIGLVLKGRTPN